MANQVLTNPLDQVSKLLSHILPKARELGIFVAFIISLLLIPAILNIAKRPSLLNNPHSFERMNNFLKIWGHFFIKYKGPVLSGTFVVLILMALGIKLVKVDSNPINYYKQHEKIRIDSEAIAEGFGGTAQLSVLIEGNAFDPEVLEKVDELSEYFQKYSLVSQTTSMAD